MNNHNECAFWTAAGGAKGHRREAWAEEALPPKAESDPQVGAYTRIRHGSAGGDDKSVWMDKVPSREA